MPGGVPVTERVRWGEGKPLPQGTLPEGPRCGSALGQGGRGALGHRGARAHPVTPGSLLAAKPEEGQ